MNKDILEIREGMADFETRILFLENSSPSTPQETEKPEPYFLDFTSKQWDAINQLKAQILHLDEEVKELRARKKQEEYTIS